MGAKMSKFGSLMTIVLISASVGELAFAGPYGNSMLPANMSLLGPTAYKAVTMHHLQHPRIAFVNHDMAYGLGYTDNKLLQVYGNAVLTKGEKNADYTNETVTGYAAGIGGIGMNGNLGDGRSIVVGQFREKGGGPTPMVSPIADGDHKSGASIMRESIRETMIANLLATELPYGTLQTLTVLATGTLASHNSQEYQDRAINVAEDPLRFGHFVLNESAEKLGGDYLKFDRARVAAAMDHLLADLPSPAGLDLSGKSEGEVFRAKLFEAIDRQAVQHGYAWAHRFFYGTISPSNAALDGRMFDFGAVTFLNGYPRVQLIEDDGPSGDTLHFKRDLLKDIRDSWAKTLPPALLAALPSEQEWFDRFEQTYQAMRRSEMVRLAGTIDAIENEVIDTPAARALGVLLVKMAEAGNDKEIHTYRGDEIPAHPGTYDMQAIFSALAASQPSDRMSLNGNLASLVRDVSLRERLISLYVEVFSRQQAIAGQHGISPAAESRYRLEAAKIRNRPMYAMFWDESEAGIERARKEFASSQNPAAIQDFVTNTIERSRREFRDAAPFTMVLNEKMNPQTGHRTRFLFNARTNKFETQNLSVRESNCSRLLKKKPAFRPSLQKFADN